MNKGVMVVMSDSAGGGGSPGELLTTGQIERMLAPWGIKRGTISQMINTGEFDPQAGPRAYRRKEGAWGRVPRHLVEQYIRDKLPPAPSDRVADERAPAVEDQ